MLMTHYREPIDFSVRRLEEAVMMQLATDGNAEMRESQLILSTERLVD